MKRISFITVTIISFIVTSCNRDDDQIQQEDQFENFTSSICENETGIEALYWDYSHGLPVPLTQIPTLANPGQQFIHSQYPILGFIMPQGYTATEINNPQIQAIGVNVIRDDNQVIWRYIPSISLQGEVLIDNILASEINTMFDFYNFNGDFEVLCTTTDQSTVAGFQRTFGARLLRFGNQTAVIWASTMYDASIGISFTTINLSAAPTAEFDNIVFETYLPISFQLLYIDDEVRDSDLDGFPDNEDAFPFDPDRH